MCDLSSNILLYTALYSTYIWIINIDSVEFAFFLSARCKILLTNCSIVSYVHFLGKHDLWPFNCNSIPRLFLLSNNYYLLKAYGRKSLTHNHTHTHSQTHLSATQITLFLCFSRLTSFFFLLLSYYIEMFARKKIHRVKRKHFARDVILIQNMHIHRYIYIYNIIINMCVAHVKCCSKFINIHLHIHKTGAASSLLKPLTLDSTLISSIKKI